MKEKTKKFEGTNANEIEVGDFLREKNGCPETQARANFNNEDFQTVINGFIKYILLGMIMRNEKDEEDKERYEVTMSMKRSRKSTIRLTSLSDEVNAAEPRVTGVSLLQRLIIIDLRVLYFYFPLIKSLKYT